MSNGIVAQIRTPSEDELKRIRELWSALKQNLLCQLQLRSELSCRHTWLTQFVCSGLSQACIRSRGSPHFPAR